MTNHWIARVKTDFAKWEAIFPPPRTIADYNLLLDFTKVLLKVGKQEAIYEIKEVRRPHNFNPGSGIDYAQYMEQDWLENQRLLLFDLGIGVSENYEGILRTPATLCYYERNGQLAKAKVENMGLLLESLRPDDADWGSIFMDGVAPVTIFSRSVYTSEIRNEVQKPRAVKITIALNTDIWFPKVLGLLDNEPSPAPTLRKWYDNHTLATCHTNRLNRFLVSIQKLVTTLGGEWRLDAPEGIAEHYKFMVSNHGIIL